ncbi:MAG: hypothetical protein IIA88_07400, partial [Bacteroidetes bacterium]|nr:hypothetical protein [Bacteroidota bacterium]
MKIKITSVTAFLVSAAMFVQFGLNAQQQIPVKIKKSFEKQKLLLKNSKSLPKTKIAGKKFYNSSKFTGSYSAKTLIAPIFTEDFEAVAAPTLPAGLSTYDGNPDGIGDAAPATNHFLSGDQTTADGGGFFIGPANAHTQFAYSNDDVCGGPDGCDKSSDYLEMPGLNLAGLSAYWLFFQVYMSDNTNPLYQDNAHVQVSTNGGFTWNTIFTLPKIAAWTNYSVDLSAYDNMADVRLRFWYADLGNWGYGLLIDNVIVDQMPQFDVSINNPSVFPRYFMTPFSQVSGYTFNANALNSGTDIISNPKLNIDVNTGLFVDSASTTVSLAAGDTTFLFTSNLFTPVVTGTYNVDYSLSITETETNLLNNTGISSFVVTDSVYSWDSGTIDYTVGDILTSIGYNTNIFGQVFKIIDTAQLTSISFDLWVGKPGEKTFAAVYTFAGIPGDLGAQPNTLIASTDTVVISGASENWTLPLNGVVLNPGWYYVGVHEAMPGVSDS